MQHHPHRPPAALLSGSCQICHPGSQSFNTLFSIIWLHSFHHFATLPSATPIQHKHHQHCSFHTAQQHAVQVIFHHPQGSHTSLHAGSTLHQHSIIITPAAAPSLAHGHSSTHHGLAVWQTSLPSLASHTLFLTHTHCPHCFIFSQAHTHSTFGHSSQIRHIAHTFSTQQVNTQQHSQHHTPTTLHHHSPNSCAFMVHAGCQHRHVPPIILPKSQGPNAGHGHTAFHPSSASQQPIKSLNLKCPPFWPKEGDPHSKLGVPHCNGQHKFHASFQGLFPFKFGTQGWHWGISNKLGFIGQAGQRQAGSNSFLNPFKFFQGFNPLISLPIGQFLIRAMANLGAIPFPPFDFLPGVTFYFPPVLFQGRILQRPLNGPPLSTYMGGLHTFPRGSPLLSTWVDDFFPPNRVGGI